MVNKQYKNVQEMINTMKKDIKDHPIKDFFFTIQCKLEKWFWDNPRDLIDNIKWVIQRGRRGYSDCDVWGLDYYLSNMIPKALKHLKKTQTILPTWKFGKESEDVALKRWHNIMDTIIYTFEIANKIGEENYIYCPSKSYNNKIYIELRESMIKLDFTTIMTLEECKKYEEGWKYFQKHFFSLWD